MGLPVYLPYLGYGLLEAWSICMFYIRDDDFVLSSLAPGLPLLSIVSSLAVVLGTLAIVITNRAQDSILHRGALSLTTGLMNAVGSLLVLLASRPLVVIGGMVMASLANAWLWVSWGDVYSALDTETGERTAIASATIQALVIAVTLSVPTAARYVILVTLAPVASILYVLAFRRVSQLDGGETDRAEHAPIDLDAKFMARMVVCLGVPILILYYLINYHVVLPAMNSGLDVTLLAGLLLFIVALVGFMRFAEGFSAGSICTITSTFLVATIVACGLGLSPSLASAAAFALMLLCQYLLILYAASLVGRRFGNALFAFGVIWLINHASGLLGLSLGFWAGGAAQSDPSSFSATSCSVLLALLFVLELVAVRGANRDGGTRGVLAGAGDKGQLGEEARAEAERRIFEERLGAVARTYGLSPRETEILALLVKGRSAPFIRDELVISLNTVTSHIKHIYAKLKVHTRQQLIDLVEGSEKGLNHDLLADSDASDAKI